MDVIKTARELADLLIEKDLGSINVKNDGVEVSVTAKETQPFIVNDFGGGVTSEMSVSSAEAIETQTPAEKSGNYITSPIVGTFYVASAPDKPPFVKVGDKVKKGQVVCIIESMKLMNEINCEFDGTVAAILAMDGEAVDFGKELIRIE